MLNIIDVVALAKAGYKPVDVKELIELSKTSDAKESLPQPLQTVTEQTVSQSQSESTEADKPAETSAKETEQPADEPDYKALYEAEKQKVNDLQIKNTQADVSTKEVTQADLVDLVKSFC